MLIDGDLVWLDMSVVLRVEESAFGNVVDSGVDVGWLMGLDR